MKTIKYQLFETPDSQYVLSVVSPSGEQQAISVGTEALCKKILKDIERGHRDMVGRRMVLERDVDIKEACDLH